MQPQAELGRHLPEEPQRAHIIVTHQTPLMGKTLMDLTADPRHTDFILKYAEVVYGTARGRWQWVRKERKDEALGGRPVDSATGKAIEGTGWEGRLLGCGENTRDRVRLLAATGLKVKRMASGGMGTQYINRAFEMLRTGGNVDWYLLLELENYFRITNAILDAQNDLDKVGQFRRTTDLLVRRLPEDASFSLRLNGDAVLQTEPVPNAQGVTPIVPISFSDAEKAGHNFLCDLGQIGLPLYRTVLDTIRTPVGFKHD